jgi:hypothetical protein
MKHRVALVRVSKAALAAAFAPGAEIIEVWRTDDDFRSDTITLKVLAEWCPEVREGEHLRYVVPPEVPPEPPS